MSAIAVTFEDTASPALRALRERMPAVAVRALNKAIASGVTFMVREVARDLGAQSSAVRAQMIVDEATPTRLRARLETTGRRIPLIAFGARGPEPSRGRGRGVSTKMGGVSRRYPHAFIVTTKSGHRGVFQRRGSGRLPIVELRGPSLPFVFGKYLPAGQARATEQLRKNLASETKYEIKQIAGRLARAA